MNIVFLGSGKFGIESLNALLGSEHTILHIFTQPPLPAGRGRKTRQTPVAEWAESNSMPFTETDDINRPEMLQKIADCKAELALVIAFGQKIGEKLIDSFGKRIINVHASLLPAYRGGAPVNWAIINGEKITGVSIITVVPQMDAGEIIAQDQVEILPDDTAETLGEKLSKAAAPLLLKTIEQIQAGTAFYCEQDIEFVSHAPKLKKSDGILNWFDSAELLRNRIHGLWPWPGAQAEYVSNKTQKSCRVIIAKAEVIKSSPAQPVPAGTLDESLNVICGKDALRIIKIKPAGGSLMNFADFVNGRHTAPGDRFVTIQKE
jgi:methionyl-tRNA formyltransferase